MTPVWVLRMSAKEKSKRTEQGGTGRENSGDYARVYCPPRKIMVELCLMSENVCTWR